MSSWRLSTSALADAMVILMDINGKVALVSGGASGLGAATARMIVSAGGRAVIVDLNEKLGQALAGELGEAARFVRADVSDPGEAEQAVKAATDAFGALHICVNCAGIGRASRTLSKDGPHSLDLFSKVIQVNLIGTFNAIRLAAAQMSKNQPNNDGERGVTADDAPDGLLHPGMMPVDPGRLRALSRALPCVAHR